MTKICTIGLGYIGIPTSIMFKSKGYDVVGVDIRKNVVESINKNILPIEEKNLAELFTNNNFKALYSPCEANVFIICVGTPINNDNSVNLKAVISASTDIYPYLKKGDMVILESTVPPKTTSDIVLPILEKSGLKAGIDFNLVHSPERVIPGKILYELVNNNRIMGGITNECAIRAKKLYESFVEGEIFMTDSTTAETSKLMENTFRNVNIAFANEVSRVCEDLKINAWDVIELANKHPRVNILEPGPGTGGHCIPLDPWFLVEKSPNESKLIKMSLELNREMPQFCVEKIYKILGKSKGNKICLLGVTYKADTDDVRESPIWEIEKILKENNQVTIYDPNVLEYKSPSLCEKARDCDLVVLCVNHTAFRSIDLNELGSVMKSKAILDTRKFFNKDTIISKGFNYYLLGDGTKEQY